MVGFQQNLLKKLANTPEAKVRLKDCNDLAWIMVPFHYLIIELIDLSIRNTPRVSSFPFSLIGVHIRVL